MDVQFCKSSRSVRAKRHRARVKKLASRLIDRYLTSIGKELSWEERAELVSGLTDTIVDATKANVKYIVSAEPAKKMDNDERVAWIAKQLS